MSILNTIKFGILSNESNISLPVDISNYISSEISSKADIEQLAYGYRILNSEIINIEGIDYVKVSAENGAINVISNLINDKQLSVYVEAPIFGKITEFVLRLSTDNVESPSYIIGINGNPINHNYSDGETLEKNSEYLNMITIMPTIENGSIIVNSYDIMSSLKKMEKI